MEEKKNEDYVIKVEEIPEENTTIKYYKSGKKETLVRFAKPLNTTTKNPLENSIDLNKNK